MAHTFRVFRNAVNLKQESGRKKRHYLLYTDFNDILINFFFSIRFKSFRTTRARCELYGDSRSFNQKKPKRYTHIQRIDDIDIVLLQG